MKTAMQQMLDELMAHEYTIPIELIVKCKELIEVEKEQIINAWCNGYDEDDRATSNPFKYYNENYGGEK